MAGVRIGTMTLRWREVDDSPTLSLDEYWGLTQRFDDELSDDQAARVILDRDQDTGRASIVVIPRAKDGFNDLGAMVQVMVDEYLRGLDS